MPPPAMAQLLPPQLQLPEFPEPRQLPQLSSVVPSDWQQQQRLRSNVFGGDGGSRGSKRPAFSVYPDQAKQSRMDYEAGE